MAVVPIGIDPIAVAKDTRKAYLRLRDAASEFKSIRNETQTMIWLLNTVIAKAETFIFDEETGCVLVGAFNHCHEDAEELIEKLAKYKVLQSGLRNKLRFQKKARWAVGTTRDAKEQLAIHILILGTVFNMLETRLAEDRLERAVNSLRSDMQHHYLSLSANMDANSMLLLSEMQVEQEQWGSLREMSDMARPIKRQILARIDSSDSTGVVHETMEAVFEDASLFEDESYGDNATIDDRAFNPGIQPVAAAAPQRATNGTEGTWTEGVVVGAALAVSGYVAMSGVRLIRRAIGL